MVGHGGHDDLGRRGVAELAQSGSIESVRALSRASTELMPLLRPELTYLPLAQTIWYVPTGLDPWNQLLGKMPGHYVRLYELKFEGKPPLPEVHWAEQEPLAIDGADAESDPVYDQAVAIVLQHKRASISLVQRHLRIGYNRAARLLEQMEQSGLVSAMSSGGNREILVPTRDTE